MKLEIDTTGKTIKIIGSAKLTEVLTFVTKTFADGELAEYTIIGQDVLPFVTYDGPLPGTYPNTGIPPTTWCDTSTKSS
jgi:hypothetical protein